MTAKYNWFWRVCVVFAVLVLIVSCLSAQNLTDVPSISPQGEEIHFEIIQQEAPLGDHPSEPAYWVITSPDHWDALEGAIPEEALAAGSKFEGWGSSLVLVVYAGVKGSSGYSIQIRSIQAEENHWTVTVSETKPDADQIVEPAKTVPYAVVGVSTDDLPAGDQILIEFINSERKVLATSEISIP